jgi:hypothetical protein
VAGETVEQVVKGSLNQEQFDYIHRILTSLNDVSGEGRFGIGGTGKIRLFWHGQSMGTIGQHGAYAEAPWVYFPPGAEYNGV